MKKILILSSCLILSFAFSNKQVFAEWEEINTLGNISVLKTTPWGILAGENDTRVWINPHNGIYISKDLGKTWNKNGLQGRGVTSIDFNENYIYAGTYYIKNNLVGLFKSEDAGNTWYHIGNNYSTSTVSAYENFILQGTFSQGLWISNNYGDTFEKALDGTIGDVEILTTKAGKDTLMASTANRVYVSKNNGDSWIEIESLRNKRIKNIEIVSEIIFANSESEGMYNSTDGGLSWEKVEGWKFNITGPIIFAQDKLYSTGLNEENDKFEILVSEDFGNSWNNTDLNTIYNSSRIYSITSIFTYPSFLIASIQSEGLKKMPIPIQSFSTTPFLEIPWEYNSPQELIEKTYSYFDHEYPLINNYAYPEPTRFSETVVTYLGSRKEQSVVNYSGHDGYDFALNLGTPIYSAYGGKVSYFWSDITGNTIVIDHINGYKTLYGHLQSVISKENRDVQTGELIGYVGTSGKTSGPHLHFSVEKMVSNQRVDPFGWQSNHDDPWEIYKWYENGIVKSGEKSSYLWREFPHKQVNYIDANGGIVKLDNKKIIIDQNSNSQSFTIFVEPYEYPKIPIQQNKLVYITGTSMLVNMYNIIGKKPPLLLKPVKIEMDTSNADLNNVWENTIKFYFWDDNENKWVELSSIFDVATKRLTGETYHFSHIAAFGELKKSFYDRSYINGLTFNIRK